MLVLSRRPGETIHIGQDVTITIVEVSGNRIRLGVEAPTHIPIWRGELETSANSSGCARRLPK